jgi:hypothetical protein
MNHAQPTTQPMMDRFHLLTNNCCFVINLTPTPMKKKLVLSSLMMAFALFYFSHCSAQDPGKQEAELILPKLRIELLK